MVVCVWIPEPQPRIPPRRSTTRASRRRTGLGRRTQPTTELRVPTPPHHPLPRRSEIIRNTRAACDHVWAPPLPHPNTHPHTCVKSCGLSDEGCWFPLTSVQTRQLFSGALAGWTFIQYFNLWGLLTFYLYKDNAILLMKGFVASHVSLFFCGDGLLWRDHSEHLKALKNLWRYCVQKCLWNKRACVTCFCSFFHQWTHRYFWCFFPTTIVIMVLV